MTQRVKYVVEVDTSQLAVWQTEMTKAKTVTEQFDGVLRHFGSSARSAAKGSLVLGEALKKAFGGDELNAVRAITSAQASQVAITHQLEGAMSALIATMRQFKSVNNTVATGAHTAMMNMKALNKQLGETEKSSNGWGFLKLFGKFQAAKWIVQQFFTSLREGAQTVDIDKVLGRQLDNYMGKLEEAKLATGGVVTDSRLKRDMALMSSFGLDMNRFSESMELVQKMAIRTGQSADYLSTSFARGISRLSPLILDNLGIQVSLKEANETYAKSVGKSTEELTKNERITALMNHTLDKLRANTVGVDLENSAASSVARMENFFVNAWDSLKEGAAEVFVGLDQAFESAGTRARRWGLEMQDVAAAIKAVSDVLDQVGLNSEAQKNTAEATAAWGRTLQDVRKLGDDSRIGMFLKDPDRWRDQAQQAVRAVFADMENARRITSGGVVAAAEVDLLYKAQLNANAAVDDMRAKYKGLLSEQTLSRIQSELFAKATAMAAEDVDAARVLFGAVATEQLRMLAMEQNSNNYAKAFAEYIKQAADEQIKANKAHEIAEQSMNFRRAMLEAEIEHLATLSEMADSKTYLEVRANEIKAEESKLLTEIRKEQEKYNEEREQGIESDRFAAIETMKARLKELGLVRDTANVRLEAEKEYFERYKEASKAQRQAEIQKLGLLIAQAEAMKLQLEIAKQFPGVMDMTTDLFIRGLEKQIADLHAKQLQLDDMKDRSGGGRDKKDKYGGPMWENPEFPGADLARELARMVDETAVPAMIRLRDVLTPEGFGNYTLFGVDPEVIKKAAAGFEEIGQKMNELEAMDPWSFQVFKDATGFNDESLAKANAELDVMIAHLETMTQLGDGMNQIAGAFGTMVDGMDELFGKNIISMVNDFAGGLERMGEAFEQNANAYKLTTAGIPVIRAFTKNLIENRRAQAGVEMIMQGAAAWAAAATGNYPAAIAHGIAAAMYGSVAAGWVKLPKGKAKDDNPGSVGNMRDAKRGDVHINIVGPIATTEAERGLMIRQALEEANRAGY